MPRVCTVCTHPERRAIETAQLAGIDTIRTIADQHAVSHQAVVRHRAHIPQSLALASEAAEVVEAGTLLDQVRTLLADARRIQHSAEAAKDLKTALAGVREQARVLELLAKLLGELEGNGTTVNVQTNVLVSAEWTELRSTLTRALQPFPAAAAAVARALSAGGKP